MKCAEHTSTNSPPQELLLLREELSQCNTTRMNDQRLVQQIRGLRSRIEVQLGTENKESPRGSRELIAEIDNP